MPINKCCFGISVILFGVAAVLSAVMDPVDIDTLRTIFYTGCAFLAAGFFLP